MRSIFCPAGLVVLIAASCFAASESPSAQEELLSTLAARISEVRTLRARETWRMEFEMSGMKQITETEMAIVFERPNRLQLKSQAVVVVSDGSNVFFRIPMAGKYMALPAGTTLDQLFEHWGPLFSGLTPDKKALVSADALKALREAFEEAAVEVLPDEAVDGRDCFVLRYRAKESPLPFAAPGLKIWLDKEWGLLRRAESFQPDEAEPADQAEEDEEARWREMLKNMRYTATVLEMAANEPVPAEAFVFTPEPGDEKLESGFGLFGGAGGPAEGFERFPLSGKPAPDFSLSLLNGETFTLSAHTGSVVLIDFWATWCGPCVRALPEVRALDEQYRTNGLVVVGVSRDRPEHKAKVVEMVEKKKLSYAIGLDGEDGIADRYFVEGIPCLVLVNREGIVQGRKVGFAPGALEGLKKDIEAVLAGQTVSGAEPLSEAELKELEASKKAQREWRQRPTALDTNVFRLVWKSETGASGASEFDRPAAEVGIAPRFVVVAGDEKLVVLRAQDGQVQRSVACTSDVLATNEIGRTPTFHFLRTSGEGVFVSLQPLYRMEREGDTPSYSSRGLRLRGIGSDGSVLWTQELDRSWYVQSVHPVPRDKDTDVLLLGTHDGLGFYDAAGHLLLQQRLGHGQRICFFQSPTDGRLQALLEQEGKAALYDVVLPPSAPPAPERGAPEAARK